MGEGFKKKVEKAYRHFLQAQTMKLETGLLFVKPELTIPIFPCHLLDDAGAISVGEHAHILLRTSRTDPALIIGVNVVGRFDGDAATTLREILSKRGVWPALMNVTVVATYPNRKMCEVSPL